VGGNAELYRQAAQAWSDRDPERFLGMVHPDVEWRSRLAGVEGIAYKGHEGVRRYFADLAETFGEIRIVEIEKLEEHGDWVVADLRFTGTGAASHATLDWEVAHAARYRGGLVVESVAERTWEDALAAIGLE
jgi:ketosteroid isomerase-like protein